MLRRFCAYADKVFDLGQRLTGLGDSRLRPQIPTASVWLSGFLMSVMRMGSLNAMEGQLRAARRFDGLTGARKPSADTIGRVFGLMDSERIRTMLRDICQKLRRNKALASAWPLRFAAVDGHEIFSLTKALLSVLLGAQSKGEGSSGPRILPPRGFLPPRRFRHCPAAGRRAAAAGRGRGPGSEAAA